MFKVIKNDNDWAEFIQMVQNVVSKESDKNDLLSKLMGDDGAFVTDDNITTGEDDDCFLKLIYIDGSDGSISQESIAMPSAEEVKLSEAKYDEFCKALRGSTIVAIKPKADK